MCCLWFSLTVDVPQYALVVLSFVLARCDRMSISPSALHSQNPLALQAPLFCSSFFSLLHSLCLGDRLALRGSLYLLGFFHDIHCCVALLLFHAMPALHDMENLQCDREPQRRQAWNSCNRNLRQWKSRSFAGCNFLCPFQLKSH